MNNRVFVATDIMYDLLAKREPFYVPAARLFTLADEGKIQIFISSLSIANLHYLLSKLLTANEAKNVLRKFRLLVNVAPLNEKIIDLALNSEITDFEDAIQYFTALQNEISLLITRNLKGYKKTGMTVMTAHDFLNL